MAGWAAEAEEPDPARFQPPNNLCATLGSIQNGDVLEVTFEGLLSNHGHFFDPYEPICPSGIGGSTLAKIDQAPEELTRLLEKDGRAWVKMTGRIFGPVRGQPDDPSMSPFQSAAQLRRLRGYGRSEGYRTTFVVEKVHRVERWVEIFPWKSRESQAFTFPQVLKAEIPSRYPNLAHSLGIEGDVLFQISVENGKVAKTEVISGDRLLIEDTIANIETWKFAEDTNARFTTTFAYRLVKKPPGATALTIKADLPLRIEIVSVWKSW